MQEYETLDERVYAHRAPQQDQHGTGESEEEHRLAAEAELKPHRQKVQRTHRNPRHPELRGSRPARMQWNGLLGEPETLRGGNHDHEPMPVGTGRHGIHDFAPVSLHRIQIAHAHAEQPPRQRVVDPGHKALLVPPLLRAGHDVRLSRENGRDE